MILFLFGSDTFRSRQYLHQLVEQFKKQRDPQGYNVVFLDGKKESADKIFAEINTAPFLAEKRMVVVENILSNNGKELLSEVTQRIKDKKMPESNVVIFWQGEALSKVKETKELQAILSKEKYAQEFEQMTGAKLAGWTQKEIERRGGVTARDAVEYLCQNAGQDMWLLNSLLDQLVAFKLGQEITVKDIELFLDEKVDDNVFNMVDAIVSGNKKMAYKLLNEQRRLGEEDAKIFGLLVWQFKILLQMADVLERNAGANGTSLLSEDIAKQLKIHPFVAKKNLAVAKKYPLAKLEQFYKQLLDIDIKTKTGRADQSLLIDLFVGSL